MDMGKGGWLVIRLLGMDDGVMLGRSDLEWEGTAYMPE